MPTQNKIRTCGMGRAVACCASADRVLKLIDAEQRKMLSKPFEIVRMFELAVAEYTHAPFVVSVSSCTMALLLAVAWCLRNHPKQIRSYVGGPDPDYEPEAFAKRTDYTVENVPPKEISIPKFTYVGVAQSILNAEARVIFRDEDWRGGYQLKPLPVFDYARRFTSGMYRAGQMQCVSFHHSKILGLATHGGAILHDDPEADVWLRRARFDGRAEGVEPIDDIFTRGFHAYMTPSTAAEGLLRLAVLPKHNADLENSNYSDLSLAEIFK